MLNYASLLHTIFESLEHANEHVHIYVYNITHVPQAKLNVIDYVMRTATADKHRGLVWGLFHRLEDSDLADDLALLAHTHNDIQEKTDRVASRKLG